MPLPCDVVQEDGQGLEPAAVLEALLFLSGEPMAAAGICEHTGWDSEQLAAAVAVLEERLRSPYSGLSLLRVSGGYQLVTKEVLHDTVKWVRTGPVQLTPMALEVLAIIAFKQPVTRAEVEKLRGVSSERIINTLLQQDLISDLGRKDSPGRPIIYGTSPYFLECLGMDSLDELARSIPDDMSVELPGADAGPEQPEK
jgi:segregation and condensation protein B